MITPSGAAKTCVACGEDVTAKPRTKDGKGRYYCTACYQSALEQKHAKRAAAPMPKAPSARVVPPSRAGLEPEPPLNILEQIIDMEPAHGPPPMVCPACRSSIPAGGFICANCGYNLQTGEAAPKAKTKIKVTRASGTVWPVIVGVFSMIFGGGGVLLYGLQFVGILYGIVSPPPYANRDLRSNLIAFGAGGLLTGLAAWLLRDGYRIFRRDPEGPKWIRFWAMAKLLVFGTCLAGIMAIPTRPLDEALSRAGVGVSGSQIKASMLLVMAWFLLWPAFVLVFFFVPRVQADVDGWA